MGDLLAPEQLPEPLTLVGNTINGITMKYAAIAAVAICHIALGSATGQALAADSRPNIIVMMTDDTSPGEYSCYATEKHAAANATPVIDSLARSGVLFNTCWATPLCTPTRAMLLTGKYGFRTGIYGNATRENDPQFTVKHIPLSKRLSDAGYATALSGKWHLPGGPHQSSYGFDTYSALGGYLNNEGPNLEWSGPWFSWSTAAKQEPGVGRIGKRNQLYPAIYWHACVVEDGAILPSDEETYGPQVNQTFALDFIDKQTEGKPFFLYYPTVLTHRPWVETPSPEDGKSRIGPGIAPQVATVEKYLAQLVEKLKAKDLYKNTIIFFCSDNPTQGYGKSVPSEFGARVPLIVFGGPIPAQSPTDALISLVDIYPTALELANCKLSPAKEPLDGVSFVSILNQQSSSVRDSCFSYLDHARMVRTQNYSMDGHGGVWKCDPSGDMRDYELLPEGRETQGIRENLTALMNDYPPPAAGIGNESKAEGTKWLGPPQAEPKTRNLIKLGDGWMTQPMRRTP